MWLFGFHLQFHLRKSVTYIITQFFNVVYCENNALFNKKPVDGDKCNQYFYLNALQWSLGFLPTDCKRASPKWNNSTNNICLASNKDKRNISSTITPECFWEIKYWNDLHFIFHINEFLLNNTNMYNKQHFFYCIHIISHHTIHT